MFTENKITEFTKTVADLPDRPQMTAQALKAYFDSSAEELRVKFNALIDALDAYAKDGFAAVDYTAADGKLTFTFGDGKTQTIDLPLELLIESGHYDAASESIVLTLANGDVITIPVSDLIDEYEADEETLTKKDNTFSVKEGVFTEEAAKDGVIYGRRDGKWESIILSLEDYAKTVDVHTAVADIRRDRKLKLLKTITLEEDVAELNVEFDKPLDEIALMFSGTFLIEETKAIAARTDGGMWYMFWMPGLALKTTKRIFYAHGKEVGERKWETFTSGLVFNLQGISDSGSTPRLVVSRRGDNIARYVERLTIFIPSNTSKNAFAAGSTIEIWGHEADENL